MSTRNGLALFASTLLALWPCDRAAAADNNFGVALRVGTLGVGLDGDVKLVGPLNARIGYSGFNYNRTVDQTNVSYDGKLKLSNVTAILDFRPFLGVFRLSAGILGSNTKLEIDGRPTSGNFTLNGNTYTAAQVGSLQGTIKPSNTLVPYLGFGFGNVAGTSLPVHVLFDVGAAYGGSPAVSLTAKCGTGTPAPVCSQLAADAAVEQARLARDVKLLKWYPVVSLGVGVAF